MKTDGSPIGSIRKDTSPGYAGKALVNDAVRDDRPEACEHAAGDGARRVR